MFILLKFFPLVGEIEVIYDLNLVFDQVDVDTFDVTHSVVKRILILFFYFL